VPLIAWAHAKHLPFASTGHVFHRKTLSIANFAGMFHWGALLPLTPCCIAVITTGYEHNCMPKLNAIAKYVLNVLTVDQQTIQVTGSCCALIASITMQG
jgi:hypothetical protein